MAGADRLEQSTVDPVLPGVICDSILKSGLSHEVAIEEWMMREITVSARINRLGTTSVIIRSDNCITTGGNIPLALMYLMNWMCHRMHLVHNSLRKCNIKFCGLNPNPQLAITTKDY